MVDSHHIIIRELTYYYFMLVFNFLYWLIVLIYIAGTDNKVLEEVFIANYYEISDAEDPLRYPASGSCTYRIRGSICLMSRVIVKGISRCREKWKFTCLDSNHRHEKENTAKSHQY